LRPAIFHDEGDRHGRRQIGAFDLPGDVFGLDAGSIHRQTAEAIADTTVR
jgi:CRP/FNR family nitrogen fixation transcriptional regulator